MSTGNPSEVSRFSSPFKMLKGHLFFSVISPSRVNHSPLTSASEALEGVHDASHSVDSGRQVGVGHMESVDLADRMTGMTSMTAGVTSISDINAASGRKATGAPRRRLAEITEQPHNQPGTLEEEDDVALGDWAYGDGSVPRCASEVLQLRYLLDGGSGWGAGGRMALREAEAGPGEVLSGVGSEE